MTRYLINRVIRGIISVGIVVAIVMVMIYSLMDRNLIFTKDPTFTHQSNNGRIVYTYSRWEEYGYLDYVPYGDWLGDLMKSGEIDNTTRTKAASIGWTAAEDNALVKEYVKRFTELYESQGYTVVRLDAVATGKKLQNGGQPQLFAYRDIPLTNRLWQYFTHVITIDSIHKVKDDVGERGLTVTMHDPVYGGDKFSPAIIGNGTFNKYLLYFDDQFPYFHQHVFTLNLGTSYSVNAGVDVWATMTQSQGSYVKRLTTYPTGLVEDSADDLHTATYASGSRESSKVLMDRYTDDYTATTTYKNNMSKMGFSFVIGIIASLLAYAIGVPIGIAMARRKDGLLDKIGTIYIVFIIAMPSLAYIFLFKAIGGKLGLPTAFDLVEPTWLMYVLPIISLALPSIADLMKWLRRYMIDQMNADYVKFARSGGLSEREIFWKHILKNACIPLVHAVPAVILGALVGAIITERVYVVPGVGNVLTIAINAYDNGVIIGVTMFYAALAVIAIILGDILITLVDPRISFTSKDR